MDISLLGAASGFHPFVVTAWGSDVLITPQESRASWLIARYVLKRADFNNGNSQREEFRMASKFR